MSRGPSARAADASSSSAKRCPTPAPGPRRPIVMSSRITSCWSCGARNSRPGTSSSPSSASCTGSAQRRRSSCSVIPWLSARCRSNRIAAGNPLGRDLTITRNESRAPCEPTTTTASNGPTRSQCRVVVDIRRQAYATNQVAYAPANAGARSAGSLALAPGMVGLGNAEGRGTEQPFDAQSVIAAVSARSGNKNRSIWTASAYDADPDDRGVQRGVLRLGRPRRASPDRVEVGSRHRAIRPSSGS